MTFAAHLAEVKTAIDAELVRLLDARVAAAADLGPEVLAVCTATRALAVRGGKRMRPAMLAAAYVACGGEGGTGRVTLAGVALELLQAYLLVHDDWMDRDDERRGGPAVHASLARHFGSEHVGAASAVLAGDWIAAVAYGALLDVPGPADRSREALRELTRIGEDVVLGQLRDLHGVARDAGAVERTHDLKTGSYTVRGPLAMGAALAGASPEQREGLARFGRPLGVAFQLRDDVLGTFGDPASTGKPRGSDLRQGKWTALIAALEGDTVAEPLLARAFGRADAAEADVEALVRHIDAGGARARVEARVDALRAEALAALGGTAALATEGRTILEGAAEALAVRER